MWRENISSKEYDRLVQRISVAQQNLRKFFPKNPLLELVVVDDTGIHDTSEFLKQYQRADYICYNRYAEDMEKIVNERRRVKS